MPPPSIGKRPIFFRFFLLKASLNRHVSNLVLLIPAEDRKTGADCENKNDATAKSETS